MRTVPVDAARRRALWARALMIGAVVALAACTPSGVLSPIPEVDVGAQTASVPAYAPSPAPVYSAPEPVYSAPAPVYSASEPVYPAGPAPQDMPVAAFPDALPQSAAPQPEPIEVAAAPAQARGLQTQVPSNPYMVAYPRFPPEPSQPSALPQTEIDCRRQLRRLGVEFTEMEPVNDGGACAIEHPIKVSRLPAGVAMRPAATLSCQMALAFSSWTRNELNPAARRRYFSGVKTIHQGSSYSCRRIAGTRTASEHSKGNALDVMRIELNSGRDIDVRKPGFFRFREKSLLNTVRAGGCNYFNTVLGPGYDRDHANHFHFDIKTRRNGYVACR